MSGNGNGDLINRKWKRLLLIAGGNVVISLLFNLILLVIPSWTLIEVEFLAREANSNVTEIDLYTDETMYFVYCDV